MTMRVTPPDLSGLMLAATFSRSFSALIVGGLVCAGLAIGYAVAVPVSLSPRETLVNVLVLIVLAVIAEELSVSVTNRVTIVEGTYDIDESAASKLMPPAYGPDEVFPATRDKNDVSYQRPLKPRRPR